MLPRPRRTLSKARQAVYPALGIVLVLLVLIGLSLALTQLVFYLFPLAQRMAENADSLVILDFARDLLSGQSVQYWNLPRAPYLFPDALLALVLMSFGWWNVVTLNSIAVINLLLLFAVCYPVMRLANVQKKSSWLATAISLSLALLTLATAFPFAMANIYWQIFASGAHFLSAILVLLILYLDFVWQLRLRSQYTLITIFLLCAATALSDSLSCVLLLLWLGAEGVWRIGTDFLQKKKRQKSSNHITHTNSAPNTLEKTAPVSFVDFLKKQIDLYCVFIGLLLGTITSFFIPRQSLVESFLSLDKFALAVTSFAAWLLGDYTHVIYLLMLVLLVLLYPAGMRQSYFKGRFSRKNYWRSAVLAPALGIICITPFFYQDVGSIRYFAFPALISIISLALLYQRLWQWICSTDQRVFRGVLLAFLVSALLGLGVWQYAHHRIGPKALDTLGIDQIGLAVSADASGAVQCIERARAQWPLADGVATYWNARPIRFASNFNYYVAQIDQGRARSGAFVWGNNGLDLVYADQAQQQLRRYNFIVTTQAQRDAHLWGNLPAKATAVITCENHQVLFFEDPRLLWEYLFPLQVPFVDSSFKSISDVLQSRDQMRSYWGEDLFTQVGMRKGDEIVATGSAGVLVFGPYIPLAPGHYRLTVQGNLINSVMDLKGSIGAVEIASALGPITIASAPIINRSASLTALQQDQPIVSVEFTVKKSVENLEFRIWALPQTRGVIKRLQLETLPIKTDSVAN